jgi:POT family proton-dependent oligopeptide transporter
VADRLLGHYRSVLIGGIFIALGHFTLVFKALPFFYSGLAFIVIGTGLLKPNISTLVGTLYGQGDSRRDAGFSIFYMGINLGALLGPLIAGYLAQEVDWHLGFGCAGVGMALGLAQYVVGRQRLHTSATRLGSPARGAAAKTAVDAPASGPLGFSAHEWKRIAAIVILFVVGTLFWAGYEQAGSTLNLFADRYTRLDLWGYSFPSSWFQSVPAFFVIALAPVFAWLWVRLGSREPSVPAKFALALLFMGLSFLILVPAGAGAQSAGGVRVSPMWLVIAYFISELGELCLSPVGLSAVTKLAPVRIVGLMMGVWFLSNSFGNKLAGSIAGYISSMPLETLFGRMTGVLIVASVVMFLLVKPIRSLMGNVK